MNIQTKPPHTVAEQGILDSYAQMMGQLPGDAPVTAARDKLLGAFSAAGLPTRRIESWHYTDLRNLLRALPGAASGAAQRTDPVVRGSVVLPLIQGQSAEASTPEGMDLTPFIDLLASGEAAKMLVARDADDLVGRLNGTFVADGYRLTVAADQAIKELVEIQSVQSGGQVHNRFDASFGAKSSATVIERHLGDEAHPGLSTAITTLELGDGAEVTWIILQDCGVEDQRLAQLNTRLGAGATLKVYVVNVGGKLVRQELNVDVAGEGAHFDLRCVNLLAGDSHTDITLTLDHNVPNTTSKEIVRTVVLDRARGVFQGQIRVAQIAQKTDAQMSCNTLLLSDGGEFAAKPELEIFADDVICGHGATVIDINHDHLFYLMARGVTEKSARALLINGFVDELIEELENEELIEALETHIAQWLIDHG
ncbi:Fe-S cluster assembly protein SufD [Hoeflea sp. YIM 152468]|uniref:Fe-S cluster assembly protein SufD n=1 Tax=Hoeflea sp. YIM 152468 TaxID=3031759 RepID=UPI0023DB4122|nr:Fe-S cluster assembly protein SufD [Hoeflea sp. YIM 152468]MDF1607523.1 Fe-S cluster assembly protein SufD [Hoeflea sp. YIM 152468]